MLDRGVERVHERELGDRLADDRQQRARALELDRERSPPLAGAQRVSGADGEGAEPVEQRVARMRLVGEQELERALRRLAQLQRHHRAALFQRLDRERAGHVTRATNRVQRDRGRERRARERRQHRALLLVAPDDARAGAGRLGRERRHLVGGPGLVRAGRQRVAREAEQVRAPLQPRCHRRRRRAGRARSRPPRRGPGSARARRTRRAGAAAPASRPPRCPRAPAAGARPPRRTAPPRGAAARATRLPGRAALPEPSSVGAASPRAPRAGPPTRHARCGRSRTPSRRRAARQRRRRRSPRRCGRRSRQARRRAWRDHVFRGS